MTLGLAGIPNNSEPYGPSSAPDSAPLSAPPSEPSDSPEPTEPIEPTDPAELTTPAERRNRSRAHNAGRTEPAEPEPTELTTPAEPEPAEPEPAELTTPAEPERAEPERSTASRSGSRFWVGMAGVGVVAVVIQGLLIHATSHRVALWSGARFITRQATSLVRGAWFIEPGTYAHGHVATAMHPPLPTLLFAVADVASIVGSTPHRVLLAVLFVLSMGLAGMTVRELAGDRAGILAALDFRNVPIALGESGHPGT